MTIEMLIFDCKESEKKFFKNNELQNFNFTFFEESLTPETVKNLPEAIRDKATVISVFTNSEITKEVIDKFKNLRIISARSASYGHICKNAAIARNIAVINVENNSGTSDIQTDYILQNTIDQIRETIKGCGKIIFSE